MSEEQKPNTIEEACARLASEFSMDRYEAQRKLGSSMLEGMLSKGYAMQHPNTLRVALTRNGSVAARAFRATTEGH